MSYTILRIVAVSMLTTIHVCMGIPLPGVRSHALQEEHSLSNPNSNVDKSLLISSYRGSIPSIISIHSPIAPTKPSSGAANGEIPATEKMESTINQLAKLLNNIYGNDNWRTMLDKGLDQTPISRTNIPDQTTGPKSPPGIGMVNGFHNTHVSSVLQTGDNSHSVDHSLSRNLGTTFNENVHGSQQLVVTRLDPINKGTTHKPLPMNIGASEEHMKEQLHSDNDTLPTSSPQQFIQKPQQLNQGTVDPNHANVAQSFAGTFTNNNTTSFKPGEMTNQQTLYQPNTAFDRFLSQTGSDGDNGKQQALFDANKVNANIMSQSASALFSANKKMQVTESPYGHAQSRYHFSAYKDAKPQAFNADTLNQVLIGSHMNMQQPNNLMFMTGKGIEIAAGNTKSTIKPVARMFPTGAPVQKGPDREHETQQPQPTNATKQSAHASYGNFVPGDLYPGMGTMTGQHLISGARPDNSPPEFLHHVPIASGHTSFDPNALNAAQNVYNPNAISWISTREVFYDEIASNSRDTESATPTTTKRTIPSISITTSHATRTTPLLITSSTAEANLKSTTTTSPSLPLKPTYSSVNSGFDPNKLNANQGQTHFVPGQMSPVYSGYMTHTIDGSHSGGTSHTTSVFGSNASINFNIGQLLGMGQSGKSVSTGFGQNVASFSPNVINGLASLTNGPKGNQSNTSNVPSYSFGLAGSAFDPNAVNAEFGNVIDHKSGMTGFGFGQSSISSNSTSASTNHTGNATSGFDPNAANVGFGSDGFGMGTDSGFGSAYAMTYDANAVNQNSIQNPFTHQGKDTASGNDKNLVSYLLGILPEHGNSQASNYSSTFIAAFNPNTVNSVSYDPSKFNEANFHLDPMDMLARNPDMDKDTLTAAAHSFNPDTINSPSQQQAVSPIGMLATNPGIDKAVLEKLKFDPYSLSTNDSSNSGQGSVHQQGQHNIFDPIALMAKLMLSSGSFQPGNSGVGQQNQSPSMFSPVRHSVPSTKSTKTPSTSIETTTGPTASPIVLTTVPSTKPVLTHTPATFSFSSSKTTTSTTTNKT